MGENGKQGFSRAKRLRIAERDGWTCQLCLLPVPRDSMDVPQSGYDPLYPSLDHIWAHSQGGYDNEENLQLVHMRCNEWRNNRTTWRPTPEQLHTIFMLVQPRLSGYGIELREPGDV